MTRRWTEPEVEGPSGWTAWIQPKRRGYKFLCCDCGLVHNMDFRIKNGHIQFRASRNQRSTGQVRRHMSQKRGQAR
jgi:hypothetical protein